MKLEKLLPEFLERQRWYAGKGRPIKRLRITAKQQIAREPAEVFVLIVEVTHPDSEPDRYQLPLAIRTGLVPDGFLHGHEAAVIGAVTYEGHTGLAYDAIVDTELTSIWLDSIASNRTVDSITFHGEIPPDPLPGRLLGVEQSNSSLVFGESYVLKLYRRVVQGLNPDLEISRALTEHGGRHIAPALGWIDGGVGFEGTLGLMQPFYRTATEGWATAVTSVRDLYAERDLHADEVGGDFAPESNRLGVVTAELHADLAEALPSGTAGPEQHRATAALMTDRLERAIPVVPELKAYADAMQEAYDAVAELTAVLPVQRIHGDYHLGQVLRIDTGWIVLDFEGEPARPLAERTTLMSPLRDVAGMLRSFDYAARHLLQDQPPGVDLEYRAVEWAQRNRESFCAGYAEVADLPPSFNLLLRAFEFDKAVYEALYEVRHRPSWLPIPLSGIARLAQPT